MKINLLALTLMLSLVGCAQNANMNVDRYQFDDLRDDDKDGVINQRDICTTTPEKTKVDNDGCAYWTELDNISWFPIDFNFDSAEILAIHEIDIIKAITTLQQNPLVKLVLIGDTSGEGSLTYNTALAERRNKAVKDYLMQNGDIEESRIELEIFSEETAFTSHLKARKRRTIAVFIDKDKIFNEEWHIYTTDPEHQ